jgi:phage terminase large subunit-like protein
MTDPVTAYAESVLAEPAKHCKWVTLACERHKRDMQDPRFSLDLKEVHRRIELSKTMRHYKGPAKGKPFVPEPWQEFIIGSLFGWKLKESGLRRFRYGFVKIPRKNGKTFKAATVALQMLRYGGTLQKDGRLGVEGGAEVYFVATKEDQAKIGWNDCVKIIKRSPGWSDRLDTRVKEIRSDANDGTCRPLGSDSDSLDGLNPSCAIKDELHAWKDRALWDQIDDAFGAREQPLDFIITTEGTVREGIHDEIDKHARGVLDGGGKYVDENFFAIIWTLDDGDDPFSEESWAKANPNLGVSKSLEYMRDQAAKARQMPGKLSAFLTKQLNLRQDADEAWLSLDQWDACKGEVSLPALAGVPSVAALDLGRVGDWSSFCQTFDGEGGAVRAVWHYWIPEATYEKLCQEGRLPVDVWRRDGYVTVTDGDVTDFAQIEAYIAERMKTHPAAEVAYDPMFATDLAMRLKDQHGINMAEFRQTFTNFTPACSELERLLMAGRFHHGGNPIARWNAGNVVVRRGPSGNMMPDKIKSGAKIDGISAALMAVGRRLTLQPQGQPGVFVW